MMNTTLEILHDLKKRHATSVPLLRRRFAGRQLEVSIEANGRLRGWVITAEITEVMLNGLPAYLTPQRAIQLLNQSYLKPQKEAIEVLPKGLGGGTKHSRPSSATGSNKAKTCEEEALQLVEVISNDEERRVVREAVKGLLKNDSENKDLNLSKNQIGSIGAQALGAALQVNQSIQSLNLEYNHIGDIGAQALGTALKFNQSIQKLKLSRNQIGATGIETLGTALEVNQSIQKLNLHSNQIGTVGAQALGTALQVNHTLQALNLYANQIGAAGAQALGTALKVNQSLQSLNLEYNKIGDVGAQALGTALQVNYTLQSLDLKCTRIGATGAQALGAALQVNQSLRSLNLWGNHIGNAGAQALGIALEVNHTLQSLDLECNQIDFIGAQALGAALQVNHTLQSLDLESNRIGDVGAQALGVALQVNHTLQLLNISMNQIGAAGVQALGAGLEVNHTLQSLFLYYNQIDNVGIQALEAALQINDTLQALSFVENQIGGTGIITEKRIKTLLQANKQIAIRFQQQITQVQSFLHLHENDDGILLEHLPQLKKLLSKWYTDSNDLIPSLQEILRQSGKTNLNDRYKEKLEGIITNLTNRLYDLWLESFERNVAALSNEYVMGKESSEERNADLGYALYDMWLTFVGSNCPNWVEDRLQSLIPFGALLDIAEGRNKQDVSELKDPHLLFQRVLSFRNESKNSLLSLTNQSQKS